MTSEDLVKCLDMAWKPVVYLQILKFMEMFKGSSFNHLDLSFDQTDAQMPV